MYAGATRPQECGRWLAGIKLLQLVQQWQQQLLRR
jgi:hypothetical protein